MNKKTLSLGFLVAILLAVTAFPTGNSLPTGIEDPNMVQNGCCKSTNSTISFKSKVVEGSGGTD